MADDLETTGGAEAPAEAAEVAPETPAVEAGAETPADDGAQAKPEGEAAETTTEPRPSRATERIRQLLEQKHELEARLAEKADEPPQKAESKAAPAKVAGHPALKGETPDEDGEVYLGGEWHKAEELVKDYDETNLGTRLERIEAWLAEQANAAVEAKRQAEEAHTVSAIADSTLARIAEIRDEKFPKAPKEFHPKVDRAIARNADPALTEAYQNGKLTPETHEKILQAAWEETLDEYGVFASLQLSGNAEYREQFKARPGGQAVTKAPKSIHELSDKQADELASKWAKDAEAEARR